MSHISLVLSHPGACIDIEFVARDKLDTSDSSVQHYNIFSHPSAPPSHNFYHERNQLQGWPQTQDACMSGWPLFSFDVLHRHNEPYLHIPNSHRILLIYSIAMRNIISIKKNKNIEASLTSNRLSKKHSSYWLIRPPSPHPLLIDPSPPSPHPLLIDPSPPSPHPLLIGPSPPSSHQG